MLENTFFFLTGLIVLLASTSIFIKLVYKISTIFRISPLIIGVTVVAIGTSLPELSVSIIAAINNDQGLALGNIVGSNITNILLVLPAGIILGKIKVGRKKTQFNAYLLFFLTLIFILLITFIKSSLSVGLFLLSLAVLFTINEYFWAIKGRSHEDKKLFLKLSQEKFTVKDLLLFTMSLAFMFFGGKILVSSVENLALLSGLSTTFLGLTITAIATSMPELLTTIFTINNKRGKIALGNIVGSNLYNLLLIGGLTFLIAPIPKISGFDLLFLLLTTTIICLIIIYYKGQYIPKKIGIPFMILFAIYFYFVKNFS